MTAALEPIPVALVHLGCARNLIDSELILARLAEEELLVTGDTSQADVCVINTCSFIGEARDESVAAIEQQLDAKRRGDLRAVVVAGCLVARYRRKLLRDFPDVDLFCEISDYRELAKAVRSIGETGVGPSYLAAGGLRGDEQEGSRLLATPGSYAYLRISHGCDHQCSFCAIPTMRGKHRSKSMAAVLAEAEELIAFGVRELTLVAEDSTAWGREMNLELPDLVQALGELDGDFRLRVMYAYPNRFPWGLTELLRDHPKVLPYLDIPVQHIATPVLRAMRRHGSGDQVRKILDRLRDEVPNLVLRTTLLMGFPGETDADAAEAVDFVSEYGIARLGAFTYSPEEGTPGFELADRVPERTAAERARAVLAARDDVLMAEQRAQVGSTIDVLVDEVHPVPGDGPAHIVGRPDSDAPEVDLIAEFTSDAAQVGERVRVRVTGVSKAANLQCVEATTADRESAS